MAEPLSPISFEQIDEPAEVWVIQPPRRRYWLHLLLFAVTCLTTLIVGARLQYNFDHNLPAYNQEEFFPIFWVLSDPRRLLLGLPFASTLLAILMTHEMGHFVAAQKHRVYCTLPFFIPFPSLIGTLGAFIKIQSPMRTRRALFDIGVAGPIAGFVVALPAMIAGLLVSKPIVADAISPIQFGVPLILTLSMKLLQGAHLNPAADLHALNMHPIAVAAWVGMFATALNLLPSGQLDGGHILYAVWPRAHGLVSRLVALALAIMGWFLFQGWLVWALLLLISGMRHPPVARLPGLTPTRKLLAALALMMLVATITPQPFFVSGEAVALRDNVIQWLRR